MKKIIQSIWLFLVLMILYLPILILAVYSFTESTMIGSLRGFSLHNYVTLFTTPELKNMIIGTFTLAIGASLISTALGTLGAIGAFYSKKSVRNAIELANQIPVVNADVVTGFSICILLIVFLGMDKNTYIPLLIGHCALCTPFVYLQVMPRLVAMDPYLYEAALDLGATPTQALIKIVLREIFPGMVSGFLTSVTLSLDDYFITSYTKPAVFDTISTYAVNATKGAQTTIKTALWALSTVIFVVIVLVVPVSNMAGKRRSGTGMTLMSLAVICMSGIVLTSCGKTGNDEVVLRVANCEEYIDEGGWEEDEVIELEDEKPIIGENSLVEDFEKWYEDTYGKKIKVEYSTYGTNEELYNQMSLGNTFDLVCPSEYMIMKLMEEQRLQPLSEGFFDRSRKENYYCVGVSPYIKNVFKELSVNRETVEKYAAGYMWGTMGIVYEPGAVSETDANSWRMLLDNKYRKRITMKDGVRDSYFVGLSILKEDMVKKPEFLTADDYHEKLTQELNDTTPETVDSVEEILADMRDNAYSLETDSGKADMVTGKVVANMQWSGDAVYTMDQAEEDGVTLCYSVPDECSNLWFDGWVMMKNGINRDLNKQHAAEAFINFISRPDNVIRNMYYIGYTSAITAKRDGRILKYIDYTYGAEDGGVPYDITYLFDEFAAEGEDDYIINADPQQLNRQLYAQYPTEDVLRRCAVMRPYASDANKRISQMWINIRCFDPWEKRKHK